MFFIVAVFCKYIYNFAMKQWQYLLKMFYLELVELYLYMNRHQKS